VSWKHSVELKDSVCNCVSEPIHKVTSKKPLLFVAFKQGFY